MSLGMRHQDGAILVPRNMPAGPAPLRNAVAPSRTELVVCVAGIFPWSWLADLCARAGRPCVLGHALAMTAMHGGNATHDNMDAQTIAVLLRGGRLPQASVYPAARRAPRDLRQRRRPLTRPRAELLTHVPHTNSQDHVPDIGQKRADKTHRPGGAARFADPAVPKSGAVARALLD